MVPVIRPVSLHAESIDDPRHDALEFDLVFQYENPLLRGIARCIVAHAQATFPLFGGHGRPNDHR
jgi:hypothetical protein